MDDIASLRLPASKVRLLHLTQGILGCILESFGMSYSFISVSLDIKHLLIRSVAGSTFAMHYVEKGLRIGFDFSCPWGYAFCKPRRRLKIGL